MIWISWLSKRTGAALLAGVVLMQANAPVSAQTTGGTGGTGLGNLGGGGGGGGGGGAGTSSSAAGTASAGSAFSNLGPSTNMGPTVTIGGQGSNTRGGSGTTNIPSASNPLGNYYYNPLQYGIISSGASLPNAGSLASTFGQPVFGTATTNTTGATGTGGQAATTQGAGFTTLGRSRAPAYYTALSPDFVMPQHAPGKLQRQLEGVLERTIGQKGQNIRVQIVEGSRVILRGEIETPRDRERAETQVRITPGVDDVQNLLVITGSARSASGPIQRASN